MPGCIRGDSGLREDSILRGWKLPNCGIASEIYRSLVLLGAQSDLLGTVGS